MRVDLVCRGNLTGTTASLCVPWNGLCDRCGQSMPITTNDGREAHYAGTLDLLDVFAELLISTGQARRSAT